MTTPTTSPTLAVALIVKNEEKHLKACLESISDWVDEIVIMDSGSTDSTETIAREFTDKFIVNDKWPGFGPQRQLAQQHITSDYVLWLDADERVTPELKADIQKAVASNNPNTAYKVNRLSDAFGKFIYHSGWSPDWVVRLYKTSETQYNSALVHEKVEIPNKLKVEKLDGRLLHYTYDNMHHYINKTTGYLKAWADEREGRKKSGLGTALLHAFACFIKMYIVKLGFLDGKHGFILAWLATHSTFVKYIDLYLREEAKKK
ncbi:glycosyltransferase family 2 protein [Aliivibrio sp. S4TY2]|uniref:glycosyltransferase family 2 protein n=1 Tax=unclassified Aliivibrio TaxID=2645654 RepID=UPI0023792286|nr:MULTISPECIES: glycosyltransferase family 2 protein [unclassified Aliivibrio]MDD9156000.1 glycosyltransferase family 2 protein [Aliivibrio sp. S4TY2]MDD9159709.1 glycosyltransferase family 2 protein [Aliivibrio sp. S4TY1]MDD9163709.1 glycosyltransferase family 2 protein [Aliivibrio sp. S4MY2]MDD9167709.1 glycosyltransferase family 2 protein [Aliivibrio sp. S4MY4]MDD9185627.1 glycosyltransferase family 2 protein [Aliivibrio sp. S4MY3]